MIKHVNIKISGKVQGVFFRATAKQEADNLGVSGFAKNEPDGSVYIEAEGEDEYLDEFLKWCKSGPVLADVEDIKTNNGKIENFSQFEIY